MTIFNLHRRKYLEIGEQMFVIGGVTVNNASEGDLVNCVLYTKPVARLSGPPIGFAFYDHLR